VQQESAKHKAGTQSQSRPADRQTGGKQQAAAISKHTAASRESSRKAASIQQQSSIRGAGRQQLGSKRLAVAEGSRQKSR
jgi:hypothetical protein